MRRRSTTASAASYEIGRGKPPVHSRYRPGQSGNPAGRRKGTRNLKTDVKRTLRMPLKVKEGARMRKKSTQEAALMVLREKALRGDARALDRLFELALRFNNDAAELPATHPLGPDDRAILADFVAANRTAPAISNTSDESKKPKRARSIKRRSK